VGKSERERERERDTGYCYEVDRGADVWTHPEFDAQTQSIFQWEALNLFEFYIDCEEWYN
jgi:hypothetical protein